MAYEAIDLNFNSLLPLDSQGYFFSFLTYKVGFIIPSLCNLQCYYENLI